MDTFFEQQVRLFAPSLDLSAFYQTLSGFSQEEQMRLCSAFLLMVYAHATQKNRVDQQAYSTHPYAVYLRVFSFAPRIEVLIAALLHDSVEDQAIKFASEQAPDRRASALLFLERGYGSRVAELVKAVSNPDFFALVEERHLPTATKKQMRESINALYAEHVGELLSDPDAACIKFADFCENALALEHIQSKRLRHRLRAKYVPVARLFLAQSETFLTPEQEQEAKRALLHFISSEKLLETERQSL